jgi:hypothetical protein
MEWCHQFSRVNQKPSKLRRILRMNFTLNFQVIRKECLVKAQMSKLLEAKILASVCRPVSAREKTFWRGKNSTQPRATNFTPLAENQRQVIKNVIQHILKTIWTWRVELQSTVMPFPLAGNRQRVPGVGVIWRISCLKVRIWPWQIRLEFPQKRLAKYLRRTLNYKVLELKLQD